MTVKNKRVLNEIARRWVKGMVVNAESMIAFGDAGLSDEEIDYMQDELARIAERITKLPHAEDVNKLVDEYFK